MKGVSVVESFIRGIHLVDWVITGLFAVPTLSRFLEWAQHGFRWPIAVQLFVIVGVWLAVIVTLAIKHEVSRLRSVGNSDTPVAFYWFEEDRS